MKTGLLLRQQVPKDVDRITFDSFYDVDDMWIWLFYLLHKKLNLDNSEIWIWGYKHRHRRTINYTENFMEKWYEKFPDNIEFDFIFSRGGFKEYLPVMQYNSNAFKLYYGAIFKSRFNPRAAGDATKYDLLLADSAIQYKELLDAGYTVHKFLKPACEHIFKPSAPYTFDCQDPAPYDVVFIANGTQKNIKGHKWFLDKMNGSGLKILQMGFVDNELYKYAGDLDLKINWTGWMPRRNIQNYACSAKVGVCCSTGDSCPRVIPEMLAMNVPVIVRDHPGLFIWNDYFKEDYASLVDEESFVSEVKRYVKNWRDIRKNFAVAKFYHSNFSLDITSARLAEHIKEIAGQKPT